MRNFKGVVRFFVAEGEGEEEINCFAFFQIFFVINQHKKDGSVSKTGSQ